MEGGGNIIVEGGIMAGGGMEGGGNIIRGDKILGAKGNLQST